MLKRTLLRLSLALLLALLLVALPSCIKGEPEETTTAAATEASAETQAAAFSITDKYVLVRPETERADEVLAMQYVKRGLDSIFGVSLQVKTDWVRRGAEVEPGEFEILIGE